MEPDINCAIRKGYFQQVRFLLEMGSSPNCRDEERRTPLMTCALIEDEPWGVGVARTLVEKGASMTLRCARGMSALHYACIYGRTDLVSVLLKSADFDIVQTDRHGNTPLHYAVTKGHVSMVTVLLDAMRKYNLGLDKLNHVGMTALMQAWRSDQEQFAKLLLSRGADVTPRDYAELKTASDFEEDYRQRQRTRQRHGGGARNRGFFLNLPQYRRPVSAMSRMSGSSMATRSSRSDRYSAQPARSRPASAHLLQRRTRLTEQEGTPEEDFLERAEKDRAAGRVIHSASQSDLRNKPDQLLNISPLEYFVKDSRYHHHPSTLSLYSGSQNNNSSWKTDIKKMYTAFQFQFTKSYCRAAHPKEAEVGADDGRGSPVHSDYDGGEKGKKQRKSSSKSNLSVDDKTDKKARRSPSRTLSRKSSSVSMSSLKSQQTLVDCSSNESVNSNFRNAKKRNSEIVGDTPDVTGSDKNGKLRSRKISAALEDHVGMVDQSVKSTSRSNSVVKEPTGQDHLGAIRE